MTNDLKIIFMGTPEFSAIVLEKMIAAGYKPIAVVTASDKPVGRHAYRQAGKQILTPSPVKVLAEKYKIQVLQSPRIENCKLKIENLQPELVVLAAYGQIIPKNILEIPKYGSLNIHPSLLPKYRGASPIQAAILNGDQETGVTIMLMDEKLDHGPILAQRELEILNPKSEIHPVIRQGAPSDDGANSKITSVELTKMLAELGAELLIETLPRWIKGEIKAVPQNHSKATFTKIIGKEDGKIDWQKSAEEIERMTRAFNPWPGAYAQLTTNNNQQTTKRLKIIRAKILNESLVGRRQLKVGQVFLTPDKKIAVACGKNALILEEVQLEGKKIMTAKNFLNGYPEIIDSKLE